MYMVNIHQKMLYVHIHKRVSISVFGKCCVFLFCEGFMDTTRERVMFTNLDAIEVMYLV